LENDDAKKVLKYLHDGPTRGHFIGETNTHKILGVGYYCPTLFKYAHTYIKKYKICQLSVRRGNKSSIPLHIVSINKDFEEWGIDIIGDINPHSSNRHKYIFIVIDSFTLWDEAMPLKQLNKTVFIQFLEKKIITIFGVPLVIVFSKASYFSNSLLLSKFYVDKGIIIWY